MTRQPSTGRTGPELDDDRERTIDTLLVAGLDQYFTGDYERAIHAWTRVLFLDRSHPRARAYIDRARSVLAERQRETDELLHRGLAALDAGEIDRARDLLASAVERGGAVEAAQVALERVERLDVASGGESVVAAAAAPASSRDADPRAGQRRLVPRLLAAVALLMLVVAATFAFQWQGFENWGRQARRAAAAVTVAAPDGPLPRPLPSELALRRARALHARGHLHQALAELEAVRPGDPHLAEAEQLRAEWQRTLLAAVDAAGSARPPSSSGPGRP